VAVRTASPTGNCLLSPVGSLVIFAAILFFQNVLDSAWQGVEKLTATNSLRPPILETDGLDNFF